MIGEYYLILAHLSIWFQFLLFLDPLQAIRANRPIAGAGPSVDGPRTGALLRRGDIFEASVVAPGTSSADAPTG